VLEISPASREVFGSPITISITLMLFVMVDPNCDGGLRGRCGCG
jgi:hypothetical protein